MQVRKDAGDILRNARSAAQLSQEAIAYKLNIQQNRISEIERGKRRPTPLMLEKIAAVLGISPSIFFEE